jgi:hypothetical protein
VTPILYPLEAVPSAGAGCCGPIPSRASFQACDTLFRFRPVPASDWLWMAGTAAAALVLGGLVFERLRDTLAGA